jgi:hypothetical protein
MIGLDPLLRGESDARLCRILQLGRSGIKWQSIISNVVIRKSAELVW